MGHAKWNRYHGDVEKYNEASFMGWRLFRLTTPMLSTEQGPMLIARLSEEVSHVLKIVRPLLVS